MTPLLHVCFFFLLLDRPFLAQAEPEEDDDDDDEGPPEDTSPPADTEEGHQCPPGTENSGRLGIVGGTYFIFFEISVIGEIPKNGPEIPQCFVFFIFFVCCCLKLVGDIFSMIKAPENDLFDHVDIYHVHYFSTMSP